MIQKNFSNKNRKTSSMPTICAFDHICCDEDCMKKFCESLREHAKIIIDFEKKKMNVTLVEQNS